ncbi:MAG: hypothetical protein KIH63_000665 [Candidatus Saccharibacteria bacterium]|nr:hypothetical protein [Candidatus Saccharibacteria bacterium]
MLNNEVKASHIVVVDSLGAVAGALVGMVADVLLPGSTQEYPIPNTPRELIATFLGAIAGAVITHKNVARNL